MHMHTNARCRIFLGIVWVVWSWCRRTALHAAAGVLSALRAASRATCVTSVSMSIAVAKSVDNRYPLPRCCCDQAPTEEQSGNCDQVPLQSKRHPLAHAAAKNIMPLAVVLKRIARTFHDHARHQLEERHHRPGTFVVLHIPGEGESGSAGHKHGHGHVAIAPLSQSGAPHDRVEPVDAAALEAWKRLYVGRDPRTMGLCCVWRVCVLCVRVCAVCACVWLSVWLCPCDSVCGCVRVTPCACATVSTEEKLLQGHAGQAHDTDDAGLLGADGERRRDDIIYIKVPQTQSMFGSEVLVHVSL